MEAIAIPIIVAAIGSSGLFTFLMHVYDKRREEKNLFAKLENDIRELELHSCRTQLLVLMANYGNETSEIMRLAKKYFVDLDGDFYMTALFQSWLQRNNVNLPIWWKKPEPGGE